MAQENMSYNKSPYEYDGETKTVQTHNNVSVPASGTVYGDWVDLDGYNTLALTFKSDSATANTGTLEWSHDGVTKAIGVAVLANATNQERVGTSPAYSRYVRVALLNGHTAPVNMSAWLYLKP